MYKRLIYKAFLGFSFFKLIYLLQSIMYFIYFDTFNFNLKEKFQSEIQKIKIKSKIKYVKIIK